LIGDRFDDARLAPSYPTVRFDDGNPMASNLLSRARRPDEALGPG
jgi:hypothetical protein